MQSPDSRPSLAAELAKCAAASKGKWCPGSGEDSNFVFTFFGLDDFDVVADTYPDNGDDHSAKANANFIASVHETAPVAFQVIQRIREHCRSSDVMFGRISAMIDAEFVE